MPIRQSICFPLFRPKDLPLDDLFKETRKIGYAAVEFWGRKDIGDFQAVIDLARSLGLEVASMCGHGTLGDGLNNPANHDRIEAELRESIDIASQNRIPGVICFSGNRQPRQTDLEGLVVCAKGLRRIIKYAEEKAVNLNVELLNSRVDHPFYLADRTDWGVALCEMVNSPRAKLLYDIYHMQIMEGDTIRTIQRNIQYIGHFHTAGNPGRHDMDESQEMNYVAICRAIAATSYPWFVGHEFMTKLDRLEAIRRAFVVCDQK